MLRGMRRFLAVLWSAAIAAAFLGPGTVTTAARAGAGHGYALLWALAFSTFACLVLQEASARLTIGSGHDLGAALRQRFTTPWRAAAVTTLVLGAIVIGCAAYEAGNILGGVAGAALAFEIPRWQLTLALGGAAALLLFFGSTRVVVTVLSVFVGVMGVAFVVTALSLGPEPAALVRGLALPSFPEGAGLLILGLVGTTVVPYNLFLGSGLARGQTVREARFGLLVAIGLGGLISMAVVVVGAAVEPPFGYEGLASVLAERLGAWVAGLFAAGLFAAGFTSAITAPLAAAMTARGLLAMRADDPAWAEKRWRYRGVWLGVLAAGIGFGLADVEPIPAIVLAQALNGVLLPVVAIFLWLAVNDRRVLGDRLINGPLANGVAAVVVVLTVLLGWRGLFGALATILGWDGIPERALFLASAVAGLLLVWPVIKGIRKARRPGVDAERDIE